LSSISGKVGDNGTGRWTVDEAHKHQIPVQLIEDALAIRGTSQKTGGTYATKLVALLRNKFGGHEFKKLE
jgi:6-phosphogluconate dehydrogenase